MIYIIFLNDMMQYNSMAGYDMNIWMYDTYDMMIIHEWYGVIFDMITMWYYRSVAFQYGNK